MKDIVFISQVIVLILNVVTFCYLMDKKVSYKSLRVIMLITFTIGLITTFGQVTWFAVLFSFTPALSLINITPYGHISRNIKKLRAYFRRDKQHLEGMERSNKTLSE